MAEFPTAEQVWFKRLDRAGGGPLCLGRGEPFRTLYQHLLEVSANSPQLMFIPAEGPCRFEPNPWHADPRDPELIKAGISDVFDRMGAAAGIGPKPPSVEDPGP